MYCCMIVYNEALTLRLSLLSILPFVEKVIIIDGAYASYPYGKHPESTDGTKRIAHEVVPKEKLIWVDCPKSRRGHYIPWAGQCAKRSEYVKRVPNGKWFIVWDGDEIIVGQIAREFKIVESSKKWYWIGFEELCQYPLGKGCQIMQYPNEALLAIPKNIWRTSKLPWVGVYSHSGRYGIYKKEKGMHYSKHHSRIYVIRNKMPKRIIEVYGRPPYKLKGVFILNLKCLQSWEKYHNGIVYRVQRPSPEP